MGCHFLLQGLFLTQGSNLGPVHILYCRWILYCWGTRGALAQKPGTSGFCALKEFLSRRISQAQRCTCLVMKVGRHPVSEVQNDGCRERSWPWLLRNGLHSYISPQEWITSLYFSWHALCLVCSVWSVVILFISQAWSQTGLCGPWVLGSETPSRLGKVNVLRLRSSLVSVRETGEVLRD